MDNSYKVKEKIIYCSHTSKVLIHEETQYMINLIH